MQAIAAVQTCVAKADLHLQKGLIGILVYLRTTLTCWACICLVVGSTLAGADWL